MCTKPIDFPQELCYAELEIFWILGDGIMNVKPLKFEDLSIEQKIGMVLTGRIVGHPDDFEFMLELVKKHALGAVQINPSASSMEKYMKPLLETADYPILIGVDMERGCPLSDMIIPGNLALGATDNPENAYNFARITATHAKKLGYNMIWSPVVDLADYDRPCIISRCFGADRKFVAEYAIQYMKAFNDCGVIGTAKHYPSAHAGCLDTHMAEETSFETQEELTDYNLYVYRKMIEELGDDMTGIMVGHTRCINIDPEYPATLSKKVIGIIKDLGFNGLTITDSMAMVGIIQKYGNEKMHGMALAAGNDLILGNYRITLKETYNYMLQNYKDGIFSEERLDDAVKKVLAAQNRTLKQPEYEITENDRMIVQNISKNCICDIRDNGVPAALDKTKKHLFVIDCENIYANNKTNAVGEISFTKWWNPESIADSLKEKYPTSNVEYVCEFPSRLQVEKICVESTKHDDVVFVTFCDSACYQGTDGLTERLRILIESVSIKTAAVVHFGNPYALEKLVHIKRLVCGFPSELCIENGLKVLSGEIEARGKMPINLKLQ